MAFLKDIGFVLKTQLNKPMAIFIIVMVISTIIGIMRGNVDILPGFFFSLKIIEYFFLFIVVINYLTTEKDINLILSLLFIVCGIICVYCLFMIVSGGDVSAPFEGSHGERNTLSGYLVLLGSVAAGVLMNTKNSLEKTLLGFMLLFLIVSLLFSGSRSGWISALVACFVLFFTAKHKNIYFLVLAIMFFALPFFLPDIVRERINFTFHQTSWDPTQQIQIFGIRLDTSTSARIFAAKAVIRYFLSNPFFGYGMTGAFFIDGQFFRIILELGILGILSFLWLLYNVHNIIYKTMKLELDSRLRGMVVGFYAGFWALIIHALSANTFIIVRISEPFWCLTGLTVVLYYLRHSLATNIIPSQTEMIVSEKNSNIVSVAKG
jgi:O-antigen ligase